MINDIILPDLATALEEFAEEVRFMEEAKSIDDKKLDVPKTNLVVNPKSVVEHDTLCMATKTSNIVLKREKPDQVVKQSPSPERRTSVSSLHSLPKSPLLLMKKPILPIISRYRWQNGFRKSKSGQYAKVALLKIELEFSSEFEFLPPSLHFSLHPDNNNNNDQNGNDETPLIAKEVKKSRNKYLCEMSANECNDEMLKILNQTFDGDFMVSVREASSTSASCVIPNFFLLVENQLQRYSGCDNTVHQERNVPVENCWNATDPILTVEHFQKSVIF